MADEIKLINHADGMRDLMKDPEFAREYWRQRVYSDLALAIYKARKQRRIDQDTLRDSLNLSSQYIRRIENGDIRNPHLGTIIDIAEALGCRVVIAFEQIKQAGE